MAIMRTRTHFKESLSWDDFSTPESDKISDEYLPASGQGDTMMSQAVTAASKIIYRWFNDGDIFATANDWCASNAFGNDLSSYANWLDKFIPETREILARIEDVDNEDDYTQLLYDLMNAVFTDKMAEKYKNKIKTCVNDDSEDSIYKCKGPYRFDPEIYEEENYYEEEDYEDDEED